MAKIPAEAVERQGYKLTKPRQAILAWFFAEQTMITAQELYRALVQRKAGVGLTSVYRNLEVLVEVGLLRQVCFHDGCQRFELVQPGEHQHHLICSGCGRVIKFSGCPLAKLERDLETTTGFTVDRHSLQIFGRCRQCQEESTLGNRSI